VAVTGREKNEFNDNKSDKRTYMIHALLIEDNADHIFLLKQIVSEVSADSIDIVHTSRLAAGIKMLNETKIDVVLLDLNLPDSSGLNTLLSVVNANSAVPVIVITGMNDKELGVKAMQNGAQDFLTKGNIDGELIRRSIRYSIERKSTEALLKHTIARLSKMNRFENIVSTVTRLVHQSIDIQEVLENSVSSLKENIEGADIVMIYFVENTTAILKAQWGLSKEYINKAGRISYPTGLTWKTLTEEKPLYVGDTDQDNVIGPAGRKLGIKSYLSVPFFSEGRAIGTLSINSRSKNAFGDEEIHLLEIISKQIEVAINNARQAEALKISETRLAEAQRMAHIGNWEWNVNTKELWWSVEIYNIFGLDLNESGG